MLGNEVLTMESTDTGEAHLERPPGSDEEGPDSGPRVGQVSAPQKGFTSPCSGQLLQEVHQVLESKEGVLGESRPLWELLLVLSAAMDIIRFSSNIKNPTYFHSM